MTQITVTLYADHAVDLLMQRLEYWDPDDESAVLISY